MGVVRHVVLAVCTAMPLALGACGGHDVQVGDTKVHDAKLVRRDATRPLGAGDIRIASVDSSVELALVGDSIVAGLGARVRDKMAQNLDTTKVSNSGLAGSIEKFVKGTVASALDHEVEFPIDDVSDVQAQGGRLVFFDKDGKQMNVNKSSGDADDDSKTFRPEDAQAFVAAFKARKSKGA